MGKPLEFQPIVQRREFYQLEGIKTNNDCAVLSQLVYWANVSGFNEFYKTDEELSEETRVSVSSIKRVKKKLKSLSFVIITRRGVPAKTYYEIDPYKILEETPSPYIEECLLKLIDNNTEAAESSDYANWTNKMAQNEPTRWRKMNQLDGANWTNKMAQNEPTIYRTKNTSKTTTENTTKKKENTAIAQIEHEPERECERDYEHEHERELSDGEFENEYELKHEHEHEHEHEEQVLSLSDESCAFAECRNDLTQSEHEEDQEALNVEEIISTLQSEILTKGRETKAKPRGHRIPQSKPIAYRSATEHDEPVAHDKPSMPQSNPKASRSRKNHDEPTSCDEFHKAYISPKALLQEAEFEEWWNTYNHKVDKKIALKAYFKATRRIKASELIKRTQTYLRLREALKKGGKFVPTLKNPATWLNNDCWDAEELRDTSTPQEKEQTALDEIRSRYRGQEAMVREQLFKNLGNNYLFFLKDAEISFDRKAAHVLVRNSIVQDELRGSPFPQVKNAFKHVDIEQLIIKNIEQDSPDVSLMI